MRAAPLAAVLCIALAVGPVFVGGHALGGRKPATAETVKAVPLRTEVVKRLRSRDPAEIQSALDDVRISAKGAVAAVPAIVDLIGRGVSPSLTQAAIDTLADVESEGASAALSWYARHRNVVLRRAALQALARTRGPAAIKALRLGLTDPDPAVRGLSATGLGSMKAKEAISDLFLALDHKVAESSAAIGQLCVGLECERLATKLGSLPFEVVTSGLDQALFRTLPDVSDDIKIKIVARVRELGTAEANRFLHDVQVKWPRGGSAKVRQTIDQAVIATSGSPGERSQ